MPTSCFPSLSAAVRLRPISIDEFSQLRDLHRSSYRCLVGPTIDLKQLDAFLAEISSPLYSDQILAERHFGAWLGSRLVGSAGWTTAENRPNARITSVFVDPLFTRCGIGRRLVNFIEDDARELGIDKVLVKARDNSVPFWQELGYHPRVGTRTAKARSSSRNLEKSSTIFRSASRGSAISMMI